MEDKFVEYLERFEEAAVHLGPQALELALRVVQFESIGYLIVGAILGIVAVLLFLFGMSRLSIAHREGQKDIREQDFDTEFDNKVNGAVSLIAAGISGVVSIGLLVYIWNWVGAFAPHIRLAKDVMDRL